MTNTNTTVSPEQLKLFACPTCALYHTGRYALPGVEQHAHAHRCQSTAALVEIYASGDYGRFYRAVVKAKAIRGHSSCMDAVWHHALTLSLPAEHTDRQRARAHLALPGLLDSLAFRDYRDGCDRGVIRPRQQWDWLAGK